MNSRSSLPPPCRVAWGAVDPGAGTALRPRGPDTSPKRNVPKVRGELARRQGGMRLPGRSLGLFLLSSQPGLVIVGAGLRRPSSVLVDASDWIRPPSESLAAPDPGRLMGAGWSQFSAGSAGPLGGAPAAGGCPPLAQQGPAGAPLDKPFGLSLFTIRPSTEALPPRHA